MKILLFLSSVLFTSSLLIAQGSYSDSRGHTHLWGQIEHEDLMEAPYGEWFDTLDSVLAQEIADADLSATSLADMQVKIFLGTWCGDTKRWVPRFVQLWEGLGLSIDQLEYVALHNAGDHYKQGPNGETQGWNIHKVPTFVFLEEGVEVGRIVERPRTDLITDVMQIDRGVPSTPRYEAVHYLADYFSSTESDAYGVDEDMLYRQIRRNVSTASELNTYGYVLKAAERLDEAVVVFRLNARLFAHDPNVHDSLGEIYLAMQEYDLSKECYRKVVQIDPDDDHAISMLAQVIADAQQVEKP